MAWRTLTGLRDADDIVTAANGRDTVFLNGRGDLVAAKLNILGHGRVKLGLFEAHDGNDTDRALLLQLDLGDPDSQGQQGMGGKG